MFELLSKLSIGKGLSIVLILFGCLIGPFWFLYQFYESIYKSTELTKFITLSFSIGIPICLSQTIFNSIILGKLKDANEGIKIDYKFRLMGISSAFCGFAFYFPCIAKFFMPSLSEKNAISMIIYIHVGALTYSLFYFIKKSVKAKQTKKLKKQTK